MNRIMGLILALSVGVIAGCASTGSAGGAGDGVSPSKAASDERGQRPSENRMTREASRNLGLAILRTSPEEQQDYFEQALESALEAIESNPQNPLGWRLAGQAHSRLGQYAQADSAFTRAVELYPGYEEEVDIDREEAWVDAYNGAIGAYQEGDMDGAIRGMEDASKIYRKRPEAYHVLGSFYSNIDETEKAVTAYESALDILRNPDLLPDDEEAMEQWIESEDEIITHLGQLLTYLGRSSDAEQVYRDYLDRYPGDVATEVNLAVALSQQEKTEEAHEVFTRLSERDDLTEAQLVMVGIGMFNADDFVAAANAFRGVAELNPYSRDAYVNLVMALLRQSLDLEESQREGAAAGVEAKLASVYKEMISASEGARELDPFNREVLTFGLRAYQGLTQLDSEASNREEYQAKLQSILRDYENLAFSVEDLSMQAGASDVLISGTLINLKVKEGDEVKLRFTIHDLDGTVLGAEEVSVTAGAPEESRSPFRLTVPISGVMKGWKYERVQ